MPADTGRAHRQFIDLTYTLDAGNRLWVRPLRVQLEELLDRNKHPFFAHAEMNCFVALRDGRPVGRIAAINDATHNQVHGETTTHFGFFDCEHDTEAAQALFDKVDEMARTWGHNLVRGPFNPSVNEEIGLQIDGFHTPNFIMIPSNPSYYENLVEAAGYEKSVDLFCYIMREGEMSRRLLHTAPVLEKRTGFTIRKFDKRDIERDALKIWEVYNKAWENNWYWVPMSRDEFMLLVANLKQIADFDLIHLAETSEGEVAGMIVAIPNINEAVAHIRDGRLLPWGLPKLLWHTRPGAIKSLRVIIMGVLEQFRGHGVDALLYHAAFQQAVRKGYTSGEFSQVLETNRPMVRAAEMMGATRYITHRMYEKSLA